MTPSEIKRLAATAGIASTARVANALLSTRCPRQGIAQAKVVAINAQKIKTLTKAIIKSKVPKKSASTT